MSKTKSGRCCVFTKGSILSLLFAYCTADVTVQEYGRCSEEPPPGHGLLFDKALHSYLTSRNLTNMTFPDFDLTKKVSLAKLHIKIYNIRVRDLETIAREGSSYIEAKWNESVRIGVGFSVKGLKLSMSFRAKFLAGQTHGDIQVFAPLITFGLEMQEIAGELNATHCNISMRKVDVRFRFRGKVLKLLNNVRKIQTYINDQLNSRLRAESCPAVRKHVLQLARNLTIKPTHCNDCSMVEAALQNILLSRGLDPVPFSVPQRNLFGSIAKVKVVNATVQGLSRLRQSGDIEARIDDCGVLFVADVTVSNLTIILNVTVTTLLGDVAAIVRINISARAIFSIVERKATLQLKELVVNTTEPVRVGVTPLGSFSYIVTSLLPTQTISSAITANLHQVLNNTIQTGIAQLQHLANPTATPSI